ncbi:hypothetical protein KKG48_02460 [Patescibacteria group bacterium]|nr:hypothetical protein [Patescibacteria group bacterium]MCG2694551.1 hypothetical protein [Candidatus Parcubacteria bacterium]
MLSDKVITLIQNMNRVIIAPLEGLMFLLATTIFIWGLVEFIWKADVADKEQGKKHMIWGIVGLFIMVSVVAIINIFLNTFSIPEVQTQYLNILNIVNFLA